MRNRLTTDSQEKLARCNYLYSSEVDYGKILVFPLNRIANTAYKIILKGLNNQGMQEVMFYVYHSYVSCCINVNSAIEDVLTRDLNVDLNKHLLRYFDEEELDKPMFIATNLYWKIAINMW